VSAVRLLVDVDVVVGRGEREERRGARYAWCGRVVHALTWCGSAGVESATFEVAGWQHELARTCRVAPPTPPEVPPDPGLELPWDLVVGTSAALARHRTDLYDVLVARADGSVTAAGRPLGVAAVHTQVLRLHRAAVGRLRCTGTVPSSRRMGWVSWVRYADGWRALTPYAGAAVDGARPMVRLEPRRPDDLARDVARWATAVAR
jgi:hypothetical protein